MSLSEKKLQKNLIWIPKVCVYKPAYTQYVCMTYIFVFTTLIVQSLYFLNPRLPASSHLLCLHSSVCVRPVHKPHSWFSHDMALFSLVDLPSNEKI